MNWVDYWNGQPTLYVSERHQQAHDGEIAGAIACHLNTPQSVVLDFGCGDATAAPTVAALCNQLYLWDAAESVRARLQSRFADHPNITVLTPATLAALPPATFDLITMSSVVQYLDSAALDAALRKSGILLKPSGKLIVADVIPPHLTAAHDAVQLLRYSLRHSFAIAAVAGLVRTALSDYRKLRATLSLSKYTEAEFVTHLERSGLGARRLKRNFGHNQWRMAFEATPARPRLSLVPRQNPNRDTAGEPRSAIGRSA